MEEHDNMDYFYQQVLQKDVTRRLQVGQDLIDYINDPQRSPDVEQDKPRLDKTIDELTGWVNSSNFKVRYLLLLIHSIILPFTWTTFLWIGSQRGSGESWKIEFGAKRLISV